jgi:hypothetical protein
MKTNDIFRDPRPGNASGGTLAPRPGRGIISRGWRGNHSPAGAGARQSAPSHHAASIAPCQRRQQEGQENAE